MRVREREWVGMHIVLRSNVIYNYYGLLYPSLCVHFGELCIKTISSCFFGPVVSDYIEVAICSQDLMN